MLCLATTRPAWLCFDSILFSLASWPHRAAVAAAALMESFCIETRKRLIYLCALPIWKLNDKSHILMDDCAHKSLHISFVILLRMLCILPWNMFVAVDYWKCGIFHRLPCVKCTEQKSEREKKTQHQFSSTETSMQCKKLQSHNHQGALWRERLSTHWTSN